MTLGIEFETRLSAMLYRAHVGGCIVKPRSFNQSQEYRGAVSSAMGVFAHPKFWSEQT